MSKGRKKIRHRKTINGGAGAGEDDDKKKSQVTPPETLEQTYKKKKKELEDSLSRQDKVRYNAYINAIEDLHVKKNDKGEDITNYDVLLQQISEKHNELLDDIKTRKEISVLTKDKQKIPLTLDEKEELKKILSDFFVYKKDSNSLQVKSFEKGCSSSNFNFFGLDTDCRENIIKRIQSFITKLRDLLSKQDNTTSSLPTMLTPDYFSRRLQQLETVKEFKELTFKNIQSAVDFLCGKNEDGCTKLTDDGKILVNIMKTLFPKERPKERSIELSPQYRSIELDDSQQDVIYTAKQKAAADTQNSTSNTKLPDVIDELVSKIQEKGKRDILNKVTPVMQSYINGSIIYGELLTRLTSYLSELPQGGGSQSVRRNKRKTKKQNKNKNKYKRSKKHHHRTKRHMKRHMKTKRHMRRHRKTKRHTKRY